MKNVLGNGVQQQLFSFAQEMKELVAQHNAGLTTDWELFMGSSALVFQHNTVQVSVEDKPELRTHDQNTGLKPRPDPSYPGPNVVDVSTIKVVPEELRNTSHDTGAYLVAVGKYLILNQAKIRDVLTMNPGPKVGEALLHYMAENGVDVGEGETVLMEAAFEVMSGLKKTK